MQRLPNEVMLLIFEFSGPDMLKVFKTIPQLSGLINTYESSLYNGALKAKYGSTFPDPLAPQTAMEFVESTNARGCQDSFCDSTRKGQVRKIHWGVNVRLCLPCWKLHVQDVSSMFDFAFSSHIQRRTVHPTKKRERAEPL